MFEKNHTHKQEVVPSKEVLENNQYTKLLENVYQHGGSLQLPELEVFYAENIDKKAINEFLNELIDFIEQKERGVDEKELERLYHFGQYIRDEFFSASPNLINFTPLPDRLKLMTKATRSKVVQGTFGGTFVGETVLDVAFTKDRLDKLTIEAMKGLSIPEKLDLLHQLRAVAAQAIAGGQWSRPTYNQIKQTYETLKNSEDSEIFVQLAAEAGIETLDAEYRDPQLGIVRFEGQTSDSRLNTRFSNEQVEAITDKFFSRYTLDHTISTETKMSPATKDALICTDRTGLATGIVRMDVEQFLSSSEDGLDFDINQYRIYKQHLDTAERFPNQRRDEISINIYHAIYNEYVDELVTNGDAESAAELFTQIFPVLNKEEWRTYFLGEIKLREIPSRDTLYREAGDENALIRHEFVTNLLDYKDQLGERYEEDYHNLKVALEHKDHEHAYEIASAITSRARFESLDINKEEERMRKVFEISFDHATGSDKENQELQIEEEIQKMKEYNTRLQTEIGAEGLVLRRIVTSLQEKVKEAHTANYEKADQRYRESMAELGQTEEIKARAEIVKKLENNLDELGANVRKFITEKLHSADNLPQLKLITLKELIAEIKGDKNMEGVTDEDVLLFQHVHSGELAIKIEDRFGFSLSNLTLKEQYFFLNYLKRTTSSFAEQMRQFTSLYGVNGMRTFLSLEREGEEFGDKIVEFGNLNQSADKVFSSYSSLLDEVNQLESFMRQEVGCGETECDNLVAKARERLLNETHKYLASNVTSDNPDVIEGLNEKTVEAKALSAALTSYLATKHSSIEDLKSFRKGNYNGTEITPETRQELEDIYRKNYQMLGYETDAIDNLVEDLDDRLNQDTTRVRTWEFGQDQTLAFAVTTENPEEQTVYVSGLNINPELKSSKAARSLLEEIIAEYSEKGWVTTAESSPQNFSGYSEMDWVAIKVKEDNLGQENHLFEMAILPNQEFISKTWSRKEIKDMVANTKEAIGQDGVVAWKSDNINEIPPLLNSSYVITRSILVKGEDGKPDYNIFALEQLDTIQHSPTATQTQNVA